MAAPLIPEGLDPWVYQASTSASWGTREPISAGTRFPEKVFDEETGWTGCLKLDPDAVGNPISRRSAESFREKIVVDLALVLGLQTPAATLMWSAIRPGTLGCVTRWVNDSMTLAEFRRVRQETWQEQARRAWNDGWLAFELWVENRDRFRNYGNILVVERPDDEVIDCIPIDFNLTLGSASRPLGEELLEDLIEFPPAPLFLLEHGVDWHIVRDAAERIRRLERQVIEYILRRAADFAGRDPERSLAASLPDSLMARAQRLDNWIDRANSWSRE